MRFYNFVVFFVACCLLCSCAGMATSQMKKYHPVGYEKLVKLVPECDQPPLESASACGVGAEMLETTSPEKASIMFMSRWDQFMFGSTRKKAESAEMRSDLIDSLVYSKVQRDMANGLQTIAIPVLSSIYQSSKSEYTLKMSKLLNIIEIDSRTSLDMFRDGHLKAMIN